MSLGTWIVVICTAYNATVAQCGSDAGITASGAHVKEGVTIACDAYPFGTVIEIDGHDYVVQDRFGHGKAGYIDIYMDSEADALKFGRQSKMVKVKYIPGGDSK